MLKKIISAVLVVAILAIVPAMICGCEKNEYKSHEQSETTHTEQHTVVE